MILVFKYHSRGASVQLQEVRKHCGIIWAMKQSRKPDYETRETVST